MTFYRFIQRNWFLVHISSTSFLAFSPNYWKCARNQAGIDNYVICEVLSVWNMHARVGQFDKCDKSRDNLLEKVKTPYASCGSKKMSIFYIRYLEWSNN